MSPLKDQVQIMSEEASLETKEKEILIKRAMNCGQITLLTKVFGRGTDFVCRDRTVISKGGVHVIQTFFSEEISEETQIMGRTARQGKDGSYSMILLNSDLEKYLGVKYLEQIEDMRNNKKTYEVLDQKRRESFDMKYSGINQKKALISKKLKKNI